MSYLQRCAKMVSQRRQVTSGPLQLKPKNPQILPPPPPSPWSYVHKVGREPLKFMTVGNLLDEAAEEDFGPREAIVSVHQGIRKTFQQVRDEAEALARGLLSLDSVVPGDRVAVYAPNLYEWYLTQLAAAKAGLILACVNPAYEPDELTHALNLTGAKVLVLAETCGRGRKLTDVLVKAAPDIGSSGHDFKSDNLSELRHAVVIPNVEEPAKKFIEFWDLATSSTDPARLEEAERNIQPDDPNNIQFTSGTTGKPKAATLSHFNVVNNAISVSERIGLTNQEDVANRICLAVPLFHTFGNVVGTLVGLASRATCVLPSQTYSPTKNVEAIHKEKCTVLYGTPTMWIDTLSRASAMKGTNASIDLSSLNTGFIGAAPFTQNLCNKIINELGVKKLVTGYGMTETSPISLLGQFEDVNELGTPSSGTPLDHLEVKVVDRDNKVVKNGDIGEIMVRGYSVMLGYWKQDDKTDEIVGRDRWLKTGDLAIMREDGCFEIVGRIKDVIFRGGENIYPQEVESVIATHSQIEEVHVFGISDSRYGEVVCAWLKKSPKCPVEETCDNIKSYLQGKLASYKIPEHIIFVDSFPKTGSGKVQKFVMRKETEELIRVGCHNKFQKDTKERTF